MPRGNDADAAVHELADQFGQGVGNAELLIDANLGANTVELRTAQQLPIDHKATAEALENIDDYEGPDGEEVVSVAVRGAPTSKQRYTVIVYRTEEGRDLVACLDDDDEAIVPTSLQPQTDRGGATGGAPARRERKERKSGGRRRSGPKPPEENGGEGAPGAGTKS